MDGEVKNITRIYCIKDAQGFKAGESRTISKNLANQLILLCPGCFTTNKAIFNNYSDKMIRNYNNKGNSL